jgi:hypothetical protein
MSAENGRAQALTRKVFPDLVAPARGRSSSSRCRWGRSIPPRPDANRAGGCRALG